MESVLLRLPIRKTDMCCMDGGGSWVDRTGSYKAISLSPLTGHGAAQHEFFLATLTIFVLFPLGYDTFLPRRARLRPLRPVWLWNGQRCEMVFHPCALRFGINSQPCIFRVLSGLHTVRLERQGPAACAAPPSPMAAPITPLARGEESTVYCTGTQCLCWPGAAEPSLRRRCVLTN
jgi:hypothetical protein